MRTLLQWIGRLVVTAAVLLSIGFAVFVAQVSMPNDGTNARADAIVALTGDEERIETATQLLATGRAERMLISGVNRRTTRAALERLTTDSHHWFECCIEIGYEARDTIGNADETSRWMASHGFDTLIVVTSDYHMPRSLIELGRAMPSVQLIAHPTPSRYLSRPFWWVSLETTRVLLAEYVKLLPATARLAASRVFPAESTVAAAHATSVRASAL
jgi:uncharacterized SAM-binding protein YcdF (DUF218 family)